MTEKSTNLHMMRFLAAVLVIVSHSFAITQGTTEREWFNLLTNNQLSMGGFAVAIFFLCGGYLTARSIERSGNFWNYLFLRLGRIVPALMLVTVCCVLIGSFLSDLGMKAYYTNSGTWRYLLNGIMILQHELPGVFQEAVYVPTVNGALWTMPVEFVCNIGCYVMFRIGLLDKRRFCWTIPLVLLGSAGIYVLGSRMEILRSVIRPCLMFYVGMGHWIYKDRLTYKASWAWICLAATALTNVIGLLDLGMALCFSYSMMTVWFGSNQHFEKSSCLGNYAYAMYLWGYPVQMFVAERFQWDMPFWLNALIAAPIALILAALTYHLVEEPTGRLIRKCRR